MSAITRDEVAHLAKLARLDLTEAELDRYSAQLDEILGAVAKVNEATAEDVPATSHPVVMNNVFRPDVPVPGLTAAEALAMAPATEGDRFRVPRILDEE